MAKKKQTSTRKGTEHLPANSKDEKTPKNAEQQFGGLPNIDFKKMLGCG